MNLATARALCAFVCTAGTLCLSAPAFAQPMALDRKMLTQSRDPRVLISAHYGFAWYVAGFPLVGKTLADIDPLCRSVQTTIGGPWRAPTLDELATLSYRLYPRMFDPTRNLWDTPDRQFFGKLRTYGDGYVRFIATDFTPYVNGLSTTRSMKAWGNGGVVFDTGFARSKDQVKLSIGHRLLCVSSYSSP
jgi:hypothetical protein